MSTLFELKTKRGRQVCFWKLQCICRGFYCHDILPLPSLYLMQVSCYFISTGENDMVKIIDTLHISMESLSLFAIYYYILAFIRQTIHNTWVKLPLVVIWLMVMASFLWCWTDQIPISNNAFVHTTDLLWELIRHTQQDLFGGRGGGQKLSVVQNFKDLLPFYTRKKLFITVKHPLEFIFMVGKEKYIFFYTGMVISLINFWPEKNAQLP